MQERLIINIVDNLNSDSVTDALSARQGKVLKEMIQGRNIITANITSVHTIQETNTYETLNLDNSVSIGNKLSLSNKQIVIGADVSKILISAKIVLNCLSIGGKYLRITKNGSTADIISYNATTNGTRTLTFAPKLIEVTSGDTIGLQVYGEVNDRVQPEVSRSFLTVEAVE